jgi:hypothetical protein
MVPTVKLLAFLLFSTVPAWADLDLTPHGGSYEIEGVKFKNVYFLDGDKKITYTPPKEWTINGGPARLSLQPAGKIQAEATVQKLTLAQPVAFTEEESKLIAEQTLAQLPKGATAATLVSAQVNSMRINAHETCEVTIHYNFFGQACARNLLIVRADKTQLTFALDCRRADYDQLYAAFHASLFSIQHL